MAILASTIAAAAAAATNVSQCASQRRVRCSGGAQPVPQCCSERNGLSILGVGGNEAVEVAQGGVVGAATRVTVGSAIQRLGAARIQLQGRGGVRFAVLQWCGGAGGSMGNELQCASSKFLMLGTVYGAGAIVHKSDARNQMR